jgi:hypothetical protein
MREFTCTKASSDQPFRSQVPRWFTLSLTSMSVSHLGCFARIGPERT